MAIFLPACSPIISSTADFTIFISSIIRLGYGEHLCAKESRSPFFERLLSASLDSSALLFAVVVGNKDRAIITSFTNTSSFLYFSMSCTINGTQSTPKPSIQ